MSSTEKCFCASCNKKIDVKDMNNPVEWFEHIKTDEHMDSVGAQFEISGQDFRNLLENENIMAKNKQIADSMFNKMLDHVAMCGECKQRMVDIFAHGKIKKPNWQKMEFSKQ